MIVPRKVGMKNKDRWGVYTEELEYGLFSFGRWSHGDWLGLDPGICRVTFLPLKTGI